MDPGLSRRRALDRADEEEAVKRRREDIPAPLCLEFLETPTLLRGGQPAPDSFSQGLSLGIGRSPGLGPGHYPQRPAVRTTEEGERILPVVAVNQVALPVGASSQRLDRVDRSHVGFDDRHDLFVARMRADLAQRNLRHPHTDGQTGAHVTVKLRGSLGRLEGVKHESASAVGVSEFRAREARPSLSE